MRQTSVAWYEATPPVGHGPGVLLLHSAWGLTDCYRRACDRLAAHGFHVVAPDLFDGDTATSWEEAQRMRAHRRTSDRWSAITRSIGHLRRMTGRARPIATVGFAMGGHWALFLAQRPDIPVVATVAFYAVRGGDYRSSPSAFQLHLAAADEFVSQSGVERLRSKLELAHGPAEFYTYPGTRHWFCEEERADAYDAAAADLAFERTQTFLTRHLEAEAATSAIA